MLPDEARKHGNALRALLKAQGAVGEIPAKAADRFDIAALRTVAVRHAQLAGHGHSRDTHTLPSLVEQSGHPELAAGFVVPQDYALEYVDTKLADEYGRLVFPCRNRCIWIVSQRSLARRSCS